MSPDELTKRCRWLEQQLETLMRQAAKSAGQNRNLFDVMASVIRRELREICGDRPGDDISTRAA